MGPLPPHTLLSLGVLAWVSLGSNPHRTLPATSSSTPRRSPPTRRWWRSKSRTPARQARPHLPTLSAHPVGPLGVSGDQEEGPPLGTTAPCFRYPPPCVTLSPLQLLQGDQTDGAGQRPGHEHTPGRDFQGKGGTGGGRRLRARPPRVSLLPRPEGRAGDMLTGPGEAPARGPGVHGELGAALSQPRLPGALMDGKLSVPGTLCV